VSTTLPLHTGRILVVVSTWRNILVRVITAFDAPKSLKRIYIVQKGSLDETDFEDA
jgi:hypothetical protein